MNGEEDRYEAGSSLADLLARANHLLTQSFNQRVRAKGLSVTEWRVLAALSTHDGLAMTDLACFLMFKQPTLTKAVDRMQQARLVQRHTPADDRRRTLVHITRQGRELVMPLLDEAHRHEAAMRLLYGREESGRLESALRLLIARLSQPPPRMARSGEPTRRNACW